MKIFLNKIKISILTTITIECMLFLNHSAYSTCDNNLPHKSPKKSQNISKIIQISNDHEKVFLVINDIEHFETINSENQNKIFEIKNDLRKYIKNPSDKYFHFIFTEASKTNAEVEGLNPNLFTLEEINMGIYQVKSGKILPHDTITISIREAMKQIDKRQTILINYTNSDRSKVVKYLLNFKKLYSEIKTNTEIQAQENLPKLDEEIMNTNSEQGKIEFQKFKNALLLLKETINNPEKTEMIVKSVDTTGNPENVGIQLQRKKSEAREKLLRTLEDKKNEVKLNSRDHNVKKTISYAEYYLNGQKNPIKKFYSISGENFRFIGSDHQGENVFVNVKKSNFNFPYITPSENPLKNMQRILQANLAIKEGNSLDLKETRFSDSEAKILETFIDITNNTGVQSQGLLKIYTSKPACISCKNVYHFFKEYRPKVDLKVYTLSEFDNSELYKISSTNAY